MGVDGSVNEKATEKLLFVDRSMLTDELLGRLTNEAVTSTTSFLLPDP